MADLLEDLGPLSFDGIQFPVETYSIRGGQRHHEHNYPKTPGGKAEKLGRALYTIHISALFDANAFRKYPDLWPGGRLAALIAKFEAGTTAKLYLPTRGTIECFATEWTQQMSSRLSSGERCEFSLIEDDEDAFEAGAIALLDPKDLATQRATLAELVALFDADFTPKEKSLFDAIEDAADEVRGVVGQAEVAGTMVAQKAERLVSLCVEAERTVTGFASPRTYPVMEALKVVWESGQTIANDLQLRRAPVDTYTTPARMALTEVARAIYGDASRGADLLALNFFRDPYAIPAGTAVQYYAEAA